MEGKIKYFNQDKGFGFIAIPDLKDRFFHVTDLQGAAMPRVGDSVSFEPAPGRDGHPIARQVVILQRSSGAGKDRYYGKPTYREVVITPGSTKSGPIAKMGILGAIGAMVGGPIGAAIGAGIGAAMGTTGEDRKAVTQKVPITRTCVKCGNQGHVTASTDGFTGFQCPVCTSFWKVRDKNLTKDEKLALGRPVE